MSTVYPAGIDTFSTKVDRGIVYHTDINNMQDAIVALETFGQTSVQGVFNVLSAEFGAVGDGIADDTAAIQAAIDAAAAVSFGSGTVTRGATVWFPPGYYKCTTSLNLQGCSGVHLLGSNLHFGSGFWGASTLKFTSNTLPGINLGGSDNNDISIEKLSIIGSTSNVNQGGNITTNHAIYGSDVDTVWVIDVNIHGWSGSAFRIDAGLAALHNIQATGCLFDYDDLAAETGIIHMGGGEPILDLLNINGPIQSSVTGGYINGYLAAVYCKGAPLRISRVVGAFAEVGFNFDGVEDSPSLISECRAEFNQGHGWRIESSDLKFVNCTAYENGKSANNTYWGWYTAYAGSGVEYCLRNSYTNCLVEGDSSVGNKQAGGFYEDNSGAANEYRYQNRYDGTCRLGTNMATGAPLFSWGATQYHIVPSTQAVDWEQKLTGVTSLSFFGDQGNNWRATINANTATEITATNLLPGQIYKLIVVQHSAAPTITLNATVFPHHNFVSPAASKWLTISFIATVISDVVCLVQLNAASGDMT